MTTNFRSKVLRTEEEWLQVASDWDRIYQYSEATLFQSFRFLRRWWQTLGDGKSPFIVMLLADEQPIGVVPLQLRAESLMGKTYHVLEFLGMPNELDRPTFMLPIHRDEAIRVVFESLWQTRSEWDLLQLDELVMDATLLSSAENFAASHNYLMRIAPFHSCPWLDMQQSWNDYFAGLSKKMRRNVRNYRNRLEKAGRLRFDIVDQPHTITAALDVYLEIERQSWKYPAQEGVLCSTSYTDFYRALFRDYSLTNQARVLILYLNDCPIAGTISIQEDDCYYALQIAHNKTYAKYSPGTVLESFELEFLMTEGKVKRYEFLGGALANKQRWTRSLIPTERLLIHKREFRTRLFDLWYFVLKPEVKASLLRCNIKPWDWPVFK